MPGTEKHGPAGASTAAGIDFTPDIQVSPGKEFHHSPFRFTGGINPAVHVDVTPVGYQFQVPRRYGFTCHNSNIAALNTDIECLIKPARVELLIPSRQVGFAGQLIRIENEVTTFGGFRFTQKAWL
jgi:hypothetical protein